jgi:hypothetical protein
MSVGTYYFANIAPTLTERRYIPGETLGDASG